MLTLFPHNSIIPDTSARNQVIRIETAIASLQLVQQEVGIHQTAWLHIVVNWLLAVVNVQI